MSTFRGIVVERLEGGNAVTLRDDLDDGFLGEGDVEVEVDFSSLNYKDALALQGKPGIVRADRLIAGIDLVGRAGSGERVLVNGCGLGEQHPGGLATRARVPAEWLVPVPGAFTQRQAAAIGTAGFTAMLAVLALETPNSSGHPPLTPGEGTVLVTGATGGVGSIAVAVLARLGHTVAAATGSPQHEEYLRSLGAAEIVTRSELDRDAKPLESQRWAAVVDAVGGRTLATAISQTAQGGTVAACGNAGGAGLPASVLPFILRGVTLAGINSVLTPRELRLRAWERLASDLAPDVVESLTASVPLDAAIERAADVLSGVVRGRLVVEV